MFWRIEKLSVRRLLRTVALLFLLSLASACGGKKWSVDSDGPAIPEFNKQLFTPVPATEDLAAFFALSDEAKADFFDFYLDPKFALTPQNEVLASYLLVLMDQFEYQEKTYTPQQTLDQGAGNCLSLSLLASAYAELAGVPIEIHLLNDNPSFAIGSGVLITSDHMRTVLLPVPAKGSNLNIFRKRVIIDFFDTGGMQYMGGVTPQAQRATYFSNRASELLADQHFDAAFAAASRALEIDQNNAAALNTVAVLHRRMGDHATAESIYQYGMKHSDRSEIFWRNYTLLLKSQQRVEELENLLAKPPLNHKDHPWQWINAAHEEYGQGNFAQAARLYDRALSLAPDLHQIHLAAAQANLAAGDRSRSNTHFEQAISLAKNSQERPQYKNKYIQFKESLNSQIRD